jgi:hypothetical protein
MNPRPEPTTINEALELYWVNRSVHRPDYAGFCSWITRREALIAGVPLPLHATEASHGGFAFELVEAAKSGGVNVTRERATPDPIQFGQWDGKQSRTKRLNKSKLLLFYLKDAAPRWRELLAALAKPDEPADSLPRSASQSEHRVAFFDAIAKGDEHTAFKLVGRLREEEHDFGEVAFLEATASFHADKFKDAIKQSREVPREAIDWPRAFMLRLESYAYLGDFPAIEAELRAFPEFVFPECFILYVCQITVENSANPEESLERAKRMLEGSIGAQPGPGIFQTWNQHSCQLAVRLFEKVRDAWLMEAALEQTAGEGVPHSERLQSPSVQRLQCALALDGDLTSRLAGVGPEGAYTEIVNRLLNYGSPGRKDFFQALATQWRIGDRSVFLANALESIDNLSADSSREARQAMIWAYQEAKLSSRHAEAEGLRWKLLEIPLMADRLREIEEETSAEQLERALSPMARLGLRSANWDLAQATQEDLGWKDAGMISLGFFRIIELEFNEQLIFPMVRDLEIADLDSSLHALRASQVNRAAKEIKVWERMLPQLLRAKEEHKGLELGALEMLLKKVASLSGPDLMLKSPIRAQLLRLLTPIGVDAFASGTLARLIDSRAIEKFRNPPAHSRYVSLTVARECKQYVEDALAQLIAFTIGAAGRAATVH